MMAELRLCRTCGARKPITDFYVHSNGTEFLDCKECWKSYVKRNREERADQYREFDLARVDDPRRKEKRDEYRKTKLTADKKAEYSRRYNESNPHKYTARNRLHAAIRDGKLSKPEECERCMASGDVEGHHPDYSKPFDVVWLCPSCHGLEHRKPRGRHP